MEEANELARKRVQFWEISQEELTKGESYGLMKLRQEMVIKALSDAMGCVGQNSTENDARHGEAYKEHERTTGVMREKQEKNDLGDGPNNSRNALQDTCQTRRE